LKELINTREKVLELLKELKQYSFFCFDTETDGLEGRVAGVSISYASNKGWYIPIHHATFFDEHLISEVEFKELFKDFFEDPENTFLGWNVGYDHRVLRRMGINVPIQSLEDSQILGWLADETKSKALKERSKIEGVVKTTTLFKDIVGKSYQASAVSSIDMAPYAIQDVQLPLKLYNKFIPLVKERGLLKHYRTVEVPFIGVLSNMTYTGIRMDRSKMKNVSLHCLQVIKEETEKIFEIAGESFNCSSNKQKQYILFTKLKLPSYKLTGTGSPSVDKEVLEDLEKMGYEIATHLLRYSQYKTLYDSFTKKLIRMLDYNDRLHGSFNQTGTITGRLSSSNPNLQQIPRDPEIRQAFIPDPGKVFVIADYSQLELRVLAHFSKDPVMLEAFHSGLDLHSVTAKSIFNLDCKVEDIEQYYKKERYIGKCVHPDTILHTGGRLIRIKEMMPVMDWQYLTDDTFHPPHYLNKRVMNGTKQVTVNSTYKDHKKRYILVSKRGLLIGSANHKVQDKEGNLKRIVDFNKGDELPMPFMFFSAGSRKEVKYNPFSPDADVSSFSLLLEENWAYFAGMFVGGGCYSDKSFAISANNKESEWIESIINSCCRVGIEVTWDKGSNGKCDTVRINNNKKLADFLRYIEIVEVSKVFRIPSWVLNGTDSMKLSYLGGLIDTDGHINKQGPIEITTKSPILAQDLCVLIQSLGHKVSLELSYNKTYKRYYYRVCILSAFLKDYWSYLRHSCKSKQLATRIDKLKAPRKVSHNTVIAVLELDEGPLLDISLDSEDRLYWANGFITHNTFNFGVVYGMGPKERLGATKERLNRYFTTHIGAKIYIDAHRKFVNRSGFTQTLSGRYRTDKRVFDRDSYIRGKGERSLFSAHIQGSASDLIKWAMVNMEPEVSKYPGANIIMQIHDELIIECYEENAEDLANILQHHMENVYSLRVPLVASPVIGYSWADKK